jgi:predicted ribosomally synthesized peptide with SipW-like signal peptide
MNKILVSLMTIALVSILVGGGIYAAFSDIETSTGNTFTAGTLNLKVGDNDPATASIVVSNVKPADTANAANWLIKNTGSTSGTLGVAIGAITNNENTLTEPESSAGDITGGVTEGELGAFLKIAVWLDIDESGTWNTGDIALQSNGATLTSTGVEVLPYDYLDNFSSRSYASLLAVTADDSNPNGTDELRFMVDYNFQNNANDNRAQGDSAVFNITFTLNQS